MAPRDAATTAEITVCQSVGSRVPDPEDEEDIIAIYRIPFLGRGSGLLFMCRSVA